MYLLGIDGGGTKTKALLSDEFGNILGSGVGGPSSIRTVDNNTTFENINIAINQAIRNSGLDNVKIDRVFAGLGDIESEGDQFLVESLIRAVKVVTNKTEVTVKSDAFSALYGGLGQLDEGVSVIVGTGSVALGVNGKNETARVGGYSYKEGDPGSAFYLGRLSIIYLSKALDGRRGVTPFSEELKEVLNVDSRLSYVTMLDEYYLNRTRTAQLAKIVTKHASHGDPGALEIANKGIKGLVEMVDTAVRKLNIKMKNVAVIGSLGLSEFYFNQFENALKKIDKEYKLFPSIVDPACGSLIGAMKDEGIEITDEIIANFKKNI